MAETAATPELAEPSAAPPAPPEPADGGRGELPEMPFVEHLRDLRLRLRNSVIALICGFAIAFLFKQELFVLLAKPLIQVWTARAAHDPSLGQRAFYFHSLIEPFWTYISVALWAGIFISSPVIFYQLWKFIAPGLYAHERRWGLTFALGSAVCFIGGAAFCYFFILPIVFNFLLSYATANLGEMSRALGLSYNMAKTTALRPLLSMQQYLAFGRKLLIAFGLCFELPVVVLFLSLIGVVTHRTLLKSVRWAIVLAFVIGAILTPPDIYSQMSLAIPLILLYFLSILIAYVVTKRRERHKAAAMANRD